MTKGRPRPGFDVVKRLVDIGASVGGLVAASPVLLVIAVLVVTRMGRPVIFTQDRPGRNGKIFRLYKFRSMLPVDVGSGVVSDAQRATRLGSLLRSTSLDELPTLVNVLKGEMSLVGPRPLLPQYLARYTPQQARRHEVRPGITGLAQVNGRNSISWEQKFAFDLEYVETYDPRLDASILWRTISSVARRHGIAADGHVTVDEFLGTPGEVVE